MDKIITSGDKMIIMGWDAAAQDKKNGIVLCECNGNTISLLGVWNKEGTCTAAICEMLNREQRILVCIDSPLGWPAHFSAALWAHTAGATLGNNATDFFARETEIVIRNLFQKKPLEVSASLIARTAFSTLNRIDEIRQACNENFNILWNPDELNIYRLGYIEVYPAATLIGNGININGYKENPIRRQGILNELNQNNYTIEPNECNIITNADDFDAFICCLSGADFLNNNTHPPEVRTDRINREGWIWAREPLE